MRLPTQAEIRALHAKHAPTPTVFDRVHTHCVIVSTIAQQLIDRGGLDLDTELVHAGSLLHDIGVYLLHSPSGAIDHTDYIRHGVLGHELLAAHGFPEALCRFCSRHTGVGITRRDIAEQGLALPPDDYTAASVEEELVMYADKFHSKTDPPTLVSAPSRHASLKRFGDDKAAAFTAMVDRFGEPDLRPLAETYGHAIV